MKIQDSNLSLSSTYQKKDKIEESESLKVWGDEDFVKKFNKTDRVELSKENNFSQYNKSGIVASDDELFDIALDPKLMKIIRAIEVLTGKRIDLSSYSNTNSLNKTDGLHVGANKDSKEPQEQQLEGWGVDYSYSRNEFHSEELQFLASGNVVTKDGAKIDFKVAFSMSKSSVMSENISIKAGDALIDPLVLNFNGDMVTMSKIKHNFDLNLDGKSDEFSFVAKGSGFLAQDKNGDGKINDGSELFGPTLGNGFEELSAYDEDNNMWIDENDSIFKKLLIWTKDEDGKEEFFTLKEKGVGALYLKPISTSFVLEDEENKSVAKLRESSIYLSENGRAGVLQELDLVV
ncbi:conserved hypothetical protein [Sulfurimonas denitrificans DSM 1251]|uniref:VCBS repeat-containing protein n=1 Tax=Sulfurimonas denitrificans (strain ATCC 33889 / DSM 1251) TaxID=326298 RepID=Q30SI4_SULDN|nr:hypothetical protein [Sulfurimonas denitrificans]ABB44047.1 conserved hypothetical protein [Sulfurimonas denitrificans DSM 1251]MDD3443407.1 hypothetical protein [Sulfurimonas denitrificans]